MIILTAITPHPPYKDELGPWTQSLYDFGYHGTYKYLEDTTNWMGNCLQKPEVILDVYNSLDDDVLWLDVDMRVKQELTLIEDNIDKYDFMCYERIDYKLHNVGWHWNAGVMFFKQSEKGRLLLETWATMCAEADPDSFMPEQKALHFAWHKVNPKTLSLPEIYNADWDKNLDDVVIEHGKASRKYKHIVESGKKMSGVPWNVTIEEGRKLKDEF